MSGTAAAVFFGHEFTISKPILMIFQRNRAPELFNMSEIPSNLPWHIYGTAWKEDRTAELVLDAIRAGHRAIDTAAQPRFYQEDLVAKGVKQAISDNIVVREELYVSKMTK
jgi:diketogulonate reductase-like aldo/keto reductase